MKLTFIWHRGCLISIGKSDWEKSGFFFSFGSYLLLFLHLWYVGQNEQITRLHALGKLLLWACNKQLLTGFSRVIENAELNATRRPIQKCHRDSLVRGVLFWAKHKWKIYNSTKNFFFLLKAVMNDKWYYYTLFSYK